MGLPLSGTTDIQLKDPLQVHFWYCVLVYIKPGHNSGEVCEDENGITTITKPISHIKK
jgi:hypothetical protein